MSDVNNRALFAKKANGARNKLRQMGGIASVSKQPGANRRSGGIMSSSPELMQSQAAMRQRPVVGVQPQPVPIAPQPVPQPTGVRRLAEGGLTGLTGVSSAAPTYSFEGFPAMDFKSLFKFGQTAVTTEGAAELGLPAEVSAKLKTTLDEPTETVSNEIITAEVPKDEQTGDIKTDLRTAATNLGIERVPAEAEIDELNVAIAGAKMGAALSGSYVNPATGQAVRPTSGARINNALAESLMVSRDTEGRRAAQEARLAEANIAARSRVAAAQIKEGGGNWYGSDEGKFYQKFVNTYTMGGTRGFSDAHKEIKKVFPDLAKAAEDNGGATKEAFEANAGAGAGTTSDVDETSDFAPDGGPTGTKNTTYVDDAAGKAYQIREGKRYLIAQKTANGDYMSLEKPILVEDE